MYLQKVINKKANKFIILKAITNIAGSVSPRYGSTDPHPDPYYNVTDPENWHKESNLSNTVSIIFDIALFIRNLLK
jgi:hypothetical protein